MYTKTSVVSDCSFGSTLKAYVDLIKYVESVSLISVAKQYVL